MSYLIRRVLAKPRLILDEMCCLYGKFASYLRRVLCKTRLIFPRINGPNIWFDLSVYGNNPNPNPYFVYEPLICQRPKASAKMAGMVNRVFLLTEKFLLITPHCITLHERIDRTCVCI